MQASSEARGSDVPDGIIARFENLVNTFGKKLELVKEPSKLLRVINYASLFGCVIGIPYCLFQLMTAASRENKIDEDDSFYALLTSFAIATQLFMCMRTFSSRQLTLREISKNWKQIFDPERDPKKMRIALKILTGQELQYETLFQEICQKQLDFKSIKHVMTGLSYCYEILSNLPEANGDKTQRRGSVISFGLFTGPKTKEVDINRINHCLGKALNHFNKKPLRKKRSFGGLNQKISSDELQQEINKRCENKGMKKAFEEEKK